MTTLAYLKENIIIGDIKKTNPYSIGLNIPRHSNIIEIHGIEREDLKTIASYLFKCIKEMPIAKKISLDKKYKTREGKEVKLFYIFDEIELDDDVYVVRGAVLENDGYWNCKEWTIDGSYYANIPKEGSNYDLVEII